MDWQFFVGVVGGIGAWCWSVFVWLNSQSQQRAQDEYNRKEKLYRELLTSLSAFYKGGKPADATQFVETTRLAWLYAPDDVVNNLYAFLNTQKGDVPPQQKDSEGRRTGAQLVVTIRKDLFDTVKKTTQLSASDFQHLT